MLSSIIRPRLDGRKWTSCLALLDTGPGTFLDEIRWEMLLSKKVRATRRAALTLATLQPIIAPQWCGGSWPHTGDCQSPGRPGREVPDCRSPDQSARCRPRTSLRWPG